jgi:hypothetical protein
MLHLLVNIAERNIFNIHKNNIYLLIEFFSTVKFMTITITRLAFDLLQTIASQEELGADFEWICLIITDELHYNGTDVSIDLYHDQLANMQVAGWLKCDSTDIWDNEAIWNLTPLGWSIYDRACHYLGGKTL